jgi:hypothetical protein
MKTTRQVGIEVNITNKYVVFVHHIGCEGACPILS